MKTFLTTFILMATMLSTPVSMAQNHRHTPRTESDSAAKRSSQGIEAYSDTTTGTAEEDSYSPYDTASSQTYTFDTGVHTPVNDLMNMSNMMLNSIFIVVILFVFSPLAILGLIFYFIYKNRKQKYKLAEIAMKTGQPIPENIARNHAGNSDNQWSKGVKNVFLGIGLICFFRILDVNVGIGIGLLVAFNGIGKMVIARTTGEKSNAKEMFDNRENTPYDDYTDGKEQ
ncbi:MAG: hypothetical protein J6B91_08595 [Prevotella sp.]|nr:hypothetical protein [Prevotella sp.]